MLVRAVVLRPALLYVAPYGFKVGGNVWQTEQLPTKVKLGYLPLKFGMSLLQFEWLIVSAPRVKAKTDKPTTIVFLVLSSLIYMIFPRSNTDATNEKTFSVPMEG
jgi:hypothetical protein